MNRVNFDSYYNPPESDFEPWFESAISAYSEDFTETMGDFEDSNQEEI